MGTFQRLGFYGVMFFIAASFLAVGCDSGRQNRPRPAPAPPAPPPPPPASPSAPPPVSEWKPDPKLLGELDDYRDIEDYQIRIPKDCIPEPVSAFFGDAAAFSKARAWASSLRHDGTRMLMVMIMADLPPTFPDYRFTAEEEVGPVLGGFRRSSKASDWQHTAAEAGTINNVPFVRVNLQGAIENRKVHGVLYLTKTVGKLAGIWIIDFDSSEKTQLDIGVASVLTFRKK